MLQTYKCPNCGADVTFHAEKQKLYCEYCETELFVNALQQDAEASGEKVHENAETSLAGGGKGDFYNYQCENCGASLMSGDETATFCSFCGGHVILAKELQGTHRPKKIIPFKITKSSLQEKYQNVQKQGLSLSKIQGVYIPYFLCDYHVEVELEARGVREHTEKRGKCTYLHTDTYELERRVGVDYEKIPADASTKMPDDLMKCLEPFEYSELVTYADEYLHGYFAERITDAQETVLKKLEDRIEDYASEDARSTLGYYKKITVKKEEISKERVRTEYVLLPVWILHFGDNKKKYTVLVNGQTGETTEREGGIG